jgi:hypothetical protein
MTYRGHCHCGAVRFTFDSEPITRGARCNCSICVRKGIVMSTARDLVLAIEGEDALRVYRWGDRDVDHYFCGTCGIVPFGRSIHGYRVNLGCIDELDVLALPIDILDGRSL